MQRYYTAIELSAFLNISTDLLWRWAANGRFPQPGRFGSRFAWSARDVEKWLASRSDF